MNNAFSIAWKDIQILLKDRGTILQLFLLPLVFVIVFAGPSGATTNNEVDQSIPLPIVSLDNGETAQTLIDNIDKAGGVRVQLYDQEEAKTVLAQNEIDRVFTIPANFTQSVAESQPVSLHLTNHPNADINENEAVRLVIDGVTVDMSLEVQLMAALEQMGEMQAGGSESEQAFAIERMQAQASSQFEAAQSRPLVTFDEKVPMQEGEEEIAVGIRETSVPGTAVLFIFMAAQTMARSIYDEKKSGAFRRLLAAPLNKVDILGGKMLPNIVTGLIQAAVIFAFGIFGLRLFGGSPATLGNDPLATFVVIFLIVLCATAFGVLIAAIARTEGQIGGLSTVLLWGLGLLIIIPPFILERFIGPLLNAIPHYWASQALLNLMVRGGTFANVTVEMAALIGFTLLFFAFGVWRFEFNR